MKLRVWRMAKSKRIILIDADVVSHFITGGQIMLLPSIFPYRIKILDKVYAELARFPNKRKEVQNLLNFNLFEIMPFPEDDIEVRKEYFYLKKMRFKGDGESACLAVVRKSNDILASSNLRDIAPYCDLHDIDYLTTMDFLCHANNTGKLTEEECDEFISKVKAAGSILPVTRISEFNCRSDLPI